MSDENNGFQANWERKYKVTERSKSEMKWR